MDPSEVESICLNYMNKLIDGLHLGVPHLKSISQIEVVHLVEINCGLVGLNFSEYIPSPERPWKDIEDIILSLQDRYGANNFHHLNAVLISQRNPKHTLCLLQIFNEIFEYYVRKGRSLIKGKNNQDSTFLASSRQTTRGDTSQSQASDTAGSSNGETTNLDSSSTGTFEQHTFVIPFSDTELDSDVDAWDSIDHSGVQNDPKPRVKTNSYLIKTEETPPGQSHLGKKGPMAQKRPSQNNLPQSQNKSPKTFDHSTPGTSGLKKPDWNEIKNIRAGPSNKYNNKTGMKGNRKLPRPTQAEATPRFKNGPADSTHQNQDISIGKPESEDDLSEQSEVSDELIKFSQKVFNIPGSVRSNSKENKSSLRRSVITKPKRKQVAITVARNTVGSGTRGSGNYNDNDGQDTLLELNAIHDEIQSHIRNQLSKMEKEIGTLKHGHRKHCCDSSGTRNKPQSQTSTNAKQLQRYDFFGNPITERFPLYLRSVIWPTCHSSSFHPRQNESRKPSWVNLLRDDGSVPKDGYENQDVRTEVFSSNIKGSNLPSKICSQILKEVLREMPDCVLDEATLKTLNKKCQNHLKTLCQVEFDEANVRKAITAKIHDFVEGSKSTITLQKKLDNAEKRKIEQLEEKVLSKIHENRLRAEKSARHKAKEHQQYVNEEVQKLVVAKKVASKQIIKAFEEALQHEKESALQSRKEKQERARKIAAEADKQLRILQDFFGNELNNLRDEYANLRNEMDPKANAKFQKIKETYQRNMRIEINRCVDKIIQSITRIYGEDC